MEIQDAVAVVTGGTGSIGRAICDRLSALGAIAVPWDLDCSNVEFGVSCDVGDATAVNAAMCETATRFGAPSLLVTVAAVSGGFSPLATSAADDAAWDRVLTAPEDWQRVLTTNVVGVANCMRALARSLIERGESGAIVNISSMSGNNVAEPGLAAYSASKAALNQLTRVAAAELGPAGIRVNAIGPGLMEMPMQGPSKPSSGVTRPTDARPPDFALDVARYVPIEQRLGRSEDIAEAVTAILSADWVTGQIIIADGGFTLRSPVTT